MPRKSTRAPLIVLMTLALVCISQRLSRSDQTTPATPAQSFPYTNRLANEKSPYLLQHAHNPVNWYPWGNEAFAEATRQHKPIFLSVGYSTCHWCHVMEAESFSDPAVAKLINDSFIPIKVDREERPDIDRVYMTFVQATTGGGGWPMTVFLTPDAKPFFGGTYFPPDDRDGMHGLKTVLTKVAQVWIKDPGHITISADRITRALQQAASPSTTQPGSIDPADCDLAFASLKRLFDPRYGGFGTAPKFPRPTELNFLFRYFARTGNTDARDMALQTLRAMAAGGIHDQLGGGFHRYSTDPQWFLPHFEKMLYDQAQLASASLDAFQITGDRFFADLARDILDYVLRDMTGPEGQFFSAEDADSAVSSDNPDQRAEGRFYVWTAAEIEAALGKQTAEVFNYAYGVAPNGNVAADPRHEFTSRNVLSLVHPLPDTAAHFGLAQDALRLELQTARSKLLQARAKRPRPRRDDKTLVAWNALMISPFARAGVALDEPRYTNATVKAANFIEIRLYDSQHHTLNRRYRDGQAEIPGFCSDYAFLIQSLLDTYQATLDIRWLQWALDLQAQQDTLFADPARGGYFETASSDPSLLLRMKDDNDNAEPAANSVAALNLLRLSRMTNDPALEARATKTLASVSAHIHDAPDSLPQMLVAFLFSTSPQLQIVLAGSPTAADTRGMLRAVNARFLPDTIILGADGSTGQTFLSTKLDFIQAMKPINGKSTAYLCQGHVCHEPTSDPRKLLDLLAASTPTPQPPHK